MAKVSICIAIEKSEIRKVRENKCKSLHGWVRTRANNDSQ